ncbi:MAG: prepilin-type cleavage/methylation domain-containing protein [Comamonadaceae bacterium]|nr:MAG: prepilin-type cleavage/methylation domain-containing protein [Comamonadaceae bacterium]
MVAMAVSGLVAIAAISMLTMSRKGFATVDAASQLQDNTRFAVDVIQRLASQAGYRDIAASALLHPGDDVTLGESEPGISGFNNATPVASDPAHKASSRTSSSVVGYGSDVLIVRYQAASMLFSPLKADGSMIDCAGNPVDATPAPGQQVASILHVATGPDGEPALMCTVVNAGGPTSPQPLVKGIESFQVLYGVDNVTPHTAPSATTVKNHFANRYLRADELAVSGDEVGTAANWRRVRNVRIGMVMRSATTAGRMSDERPLYPLGGLSASGSGQDGSAFASDRDIGTVSKRLPDGRLRQSITFTAHLRNEQDV